MKREYSERKMQDENQDFGRQLIGLQDRLTRFAYRLTCDYNDAMDLTQETMRKALENRDKYEDGTNLRAWTFKILKHSFINEYRRKSRIDSKTDPAHDSYALQEMSGKFHDYADSGIIMEDIEREIGKLNEEQRIPFLMHTEGYKYKEIADTLNLKIGTVKSRIAFARKNLMKKVDGR